MFVHRSASDSVGALFYARFSAVVNAYLLRPDVWPLAAPVLYRAVGASSGQGHNLPWQVLLAVTKELASLQQAPSRATPTTADSLRPQQASGTYPHSGHCVEVVVGPARPTSIATGLCFKLPRVGLGENSSAQTAPNPDKAQNSGASGIRCGSECPRGALPVQRWAAVFAMNHAPVCPPAYIALHRARSILLSRHSYHASRASVSPLPHCVSPCSARAVPRVRPIAFADASLQHVALLQAWLDGPPPAPPTPAARTASSSSASSSSSSSAALGGKLVSALTLLQLLASLCPGVLVEAGVARPRLPDDSEAFVGRALAGALAHTAPLAARVCALGLLHHLLRGYAASAPVPYLRGGAPVALSRLHGTVAALIRWRLLWSFYGRCLNCCWWRPSCPHCYALIGVRNCGPGMSRGGIVYVLCTTVSLGDCLCPLHISLMGG